MILGFKQYFPDGTSTKFKSLIKTGVKIHSMREGNRWKPGMSIQMAYGVRTNQYEQFNKSRNDLQICQSTQVIFMTISGGTIKVHVDGRRLTDRVVDKLIANDGLTKKQFIDWFFKDRDFWTGQIIHWTPYRY